MLVIVIEGMMTDLLLFIEIFVIFKKFCSFIKPIILVLFSTSCNT